jgi:predicted RNA methylase
MLDLFASHWVLIAQIVVVVSLFVGIWVYLPTLWGAPWVPVPFSTAKKMLRMANVQPGQRVVDLGAGDGRIVLIAALSFQAQAVGVEIDPIRCLVANTLILLLGLRRRAHVHRGNMFDFDLANADVVTLFLLQGTNQRIKRQLVEQLRPGAKVVSHAFSISGWTPAAIDERRRIFMYEIGNTGSDVRTAFV